MHYILLKVGFNLKSALYSRLNGDDIDLLCEYLSKMYNI